MPQTKQAIKTLRQSKKRAHRNQLVKSEIRTLVKKTRKAIDAKAADVDEL
jgi:ribosomal protein S20